MFSLKENEEKGKGSSDLVVNIAKLNQKVLYLELVTS